MVLLPPLMANIEWALDVGSSLSHFL